MVRLLHLAHKTEKKEHVLDWFIIRSRPLCILSSSVWTARRSFSRAFFFSSAFFRRFFWAVRSPAASVEMK